MTNLNPHFDVRPSVITGDTADVYLHRTMRVLRNEGMNPMVAMEFYSTREGVLCGAQEVKAVLSRVTSEANRQVWAMEEGEEVNTNEVCLLIRAPYSTFGLYETAICGILAHSTGWATAARACGLCGGGPRHTYRLGGRPQRAPLRGAGHGLRRRRGRLLQRFHGPGHQAGGDSHYRYRLGCASSDYGRSGEGGQRIR